MEHIKTVMDKLSLAPVKQELSTCVNGDSRFIEALKSNKLSDCTGEEIKEVLRLVMLKIGIRAVNLPDPLETKVLVDHIITNFSNHTREEIKLAFDMAINGRLEVDANCYENFSCLYFSGIMNAYRNWAKNEYRDTEKITDMPVQKLYTDQEILNQRRGEIEIAFQAMRRGKFPLVHPYWYDVLKGDNLLQDGENLDMFFVRVINSDVKNIYKNA